MINYLASRNSMKLKENLVHLDDRLGIIRNSELYGQFRGRNCPHSFAVQALIRWYRSGANVQSNLPKLAMYMGHVSIVSTAHYLHFVPSLRALASNRFEEAFGDLIEEMSA